MHFIDFVPPLVGLDAEFNTFRLGRFYSKTLKPGDKVALVDTKAKAIVGHAIVTGIAVGQLGELLLEHAATNHTQIGSDSMTAHERLYDVMQKLYGPHIATIKRTATVIHLRRLTDGVAEISDADAGDQLPLWEVQGATAPRDSGGRPGIPPVAS